MTPKFRREHACGVAGCHRLCQLRDRAGQRAVAQHKRQQQQQFDRDGRPYYGSRGPNQVYQQGPHTRVYVTTRSWLDAGTEVLPGDRKFQDYAFPPDIGYPSFARENNNRPIDRQPLNTPRIWAAIPRGFPLY